MSKTQETALTQDIVVLIGRGFHLGGSRGVCYSCGAVTFVTYVAVDMLRPLTMLAIPIAAGVIVACAAGSHPAVKYPPRKPGCALSIYHTDLPGVQDWDELGKVEVLCHIDDTEKSCFNRLHAEACRMGGDIIYHLPRQPWRPKEEALGYRALVAHRRAPRERDAGTPVVDPSLPPPASPEESAGPVVPLTGPGAVPLDVPADAGAPDAGSTAG